MPTLFRKVILVSLILLSSSVSSVFADFVQLGTEPTVNDFNVRYDAKG